MTPLVSASFSFLYYYVILVSLCSFFDLFYLRRRRCFSNGRASFVAAVLGPRVGRLRLVPFRQPRYASQSILVCLASFARV